MSEELNIKLKSKTDKYRLLLLLAFILPLCQAFGQNQSIKGIVTDTAGTPLVGANIVLLETGYGAATNLEGKYEIKNVKPGKYTVEFSSVGYKSKTYFGITVKDKTVILNQVLRQTAIESRQVVVTASKYAQEISELPVSADVLQADELNKKDITDLQDAMRYVPGVNMVDDQISIRGSSGYSRGAGTRVLLEIDGIPYYTGDTGEIIWEIIPVTEIQRVEVIKGAASSLYGSSAIGGVVNVITKGIPSKPVTYIKTSFGAYDNPSYQIWQWTKKLRSYNGITVSHSNRIGNFGFAVSLTRLSDLSYKQSGFYKRYIGYFKGIYNFSPSSSITFFANGLNQDHGNFLYWKDSRNALVPPDADQGQRVNSDRYMFGAIYKQIINESLFMNVKASYYRSDWWDQTASFDTSLSNLFRLEVQLNASLSRKIMLVSGVEGTTDKVKSNIFGSPDSYGFGAYSQADFTFDSPLRLSAGIRYDYSKLSSNIGVSALSPKAGINYKLNDKLILRSSFGTGFRAPSLAEAFTSTYAGGITIKPNPNLKPERNWTFEIGANFTLNEFVNFDAAVFQNEYYDFIEPGVDLTDGLVRFQNLTRARIQGVELNAKTSLLDDKLRLSVNYLYLWARDLQSNQPLKYRPRNSVIASLDYYYSGLDLGADFRYSSRVEQMDFELVDLGLVRDGRKRVPIYVLDLRAGYKINLFDEPVRINFNANNVLNYNYVELIGNLAPIRNYSLSLEFLL